MDDHTSVRTIRNSGAGGLAVHRWNQWFVDQASLSLQPHLFEKKNSSGSLNVKPNLLFLDLLPSCHLRNTTSAPSV
jgi:hypothetical protein